MDGSLRWLPGIFRNSSRKGPPTPCQAAAAISVEPLEERLCYRRPNAAPSAAAQNAPGACRSLDPAVAQADYAAHQSITRSDLLSIFTEIEQDHVVTRPSFPACAAMVSNATQIGMPASVANWPTRWSTAIRPTSSSSRRPARTAISLPVARPRSSSRWSRIGSRGWAPSP